MADRQIVRSDQQEIANVSLGPPDKTPQRILGLAMSVPIGLAIVLPAHALLLGVAGGVYVAFTAVWIGIFLKHWNRFGTENNLALQALGRGEITKAREVFVQWAPSRYAPISANARHNLGWTLMLEGRVAEAAKLLEDTADNYHRALARTSLLPITRLDTALCYALLGDVEKAESWRVKSELPVKGPPRPNFPGMQALLRATIDCRKGQTAEAMVTLEHAWSDHEANMTGSTLRMMRVLRAFACAMEGPRNQGVVDRMLHDMKPRYEGEFAFLAGAWPEMATFLTTHGIYA